MYQRTLASIIKEVNDNFPVLLVTGPRQAGKTTLLEMCAERDRNYVTLDNLEARTLAQNDPGLFVQTHKPPLIIDEVQYAPNLFSHIKTIVDREKTNGLFWLAGSRKLHLIKDTTESLAGRVATIDLLGLSQAETDEHWERLTPFLPSPGWIDNAKRTIENPKTLTETYKRVWQGTFPRVVEATDSVRNLFYQSYIQTYIQRDVKDVLSISDETLFYSFLGAVAARTGQLLNYADLARDTAIDNKTAKSWLSVLETSGLVYLLKPYHRNVTKRLVKSPKLYFLDTGLCAYLAKWPTPDSLEAGAMSGAILKTYLFSEILKSYYHNGVKPHFYYYRDLDQKEIDLVIETGDSLYPVEFKKTATPSAKDFKHFRLLEKLGKKVGHGAVFCFIEQDVALSENVTAIPVSYL